MEVSLHPSSSEADSPSCYGIGNYSVSMSSLFLGLQGYSSSWSVFDPLYNRTYAIQVPDELIDARIYSSKYGWLLMSRARQIFFFQPFTKQRINLPLIEDEPDPDCPTTFMRLSFSSPPTSSDCMVFAIDDGTIRNHVTISFIRRGEDSWTTIYVPNKKRTQSGKLFLSNCTVNTRMKSSHSNPVYHNGAFYCLFEDRRLGVFDPREPEDTSWVILNKLKHPFKSRQQENCLVECKGELFLVSVGRGGEYVGVFKLKLQKKRTTWEEVESLGDEMIFVSRTSSVYVSVTSENSQLKGMENKVYFPRFYENDGVFYSLETCNFHSFGIGYTSEDLCGTRKQLHCAWITPTSQVYSQEDLKWVLDTEYLNPSIASTSRIGRTSIKANEEKQAAKMQPWLSIYDGENYENLILFNLLKGCQNSESEGIPEIVGTYLLACSYDDWLLLSDKLSSGLFLFNPISKEKIQLPDRVAQCRSAILSSPNDPNCIVLLHSSDGVRYCRLSNREWTLKRIKEDPTPRIGDIEDIIGFKGKFYVLTTRKLYSIDQLDPVITMTEVGEALPAPLFEGSCYGYVRMFQLCGELFAFNKVSFGDGNIVQEIEVFKMDFSRKVWERVENLGDNAFVWCEYSIISFPTKGSKIKGSTILFTDYESLFALNLVHGSISEVHTPFRDKHDIFFAYAFLA